jgi:hypothetical protein
MIIACGSECPRYPSQPRAGNAFAAAVLAAIPGLLLLIVLFGSEPMTADTGYWVEKTGLWSTVE